MFLSAVVGMMSCIKVIAGCFGVLLMCCPTDFLLLLLLMALHVFTIYDLLKFELCHSIAYLCIFITKGNNLLKIIVHTNSGM